MPYTIEPRAVTDFLKEKLELPVFQRAPSWKERQNFNLLLSVFKGFPIGVVVVSSEMSGSRRVLLDGRQRREALAQMTDPEAIAHWAFKTLRLRGKRLGKNATSEEWKEAFWGRVEEFLGNQEAEPVGIEDMTTSDGSEAKPEEPDDDADEADALMPEDDQDEEDDDESAGNLTEEAESLPAPPESLSLRNLEPMEELLQVLLLSRKKAFTQLFDFRSELGSHPKLKYVAINPAGAEDVSTSALSEWILSALASRLDTEDLSPDTLFAALDSDHVVLDEDALRARINEDWHKLSSRIRAVLRLEEYLRKTRLGYVEVSAPTAADEMKIFELINTGGTPLTSAEILSAKRDWNIEVPEAPAEVRSSRINLYQDALKIPPKDSVVRRWDVAATAIDRLAMPWIFGTFNIRKKAQFESQTILGFQLYSGAYLGRLMKDDLGELGSREDVQWATTAFDDDIKGAVSAAASIPISYWQQWSKSDLSLKSSMSAAVALEFLLVLLADWQRKDRPTSGAKHLALQRNAARHLDRLIYEYLTRRWAGSSDSKIAADLRAFRDGPSVVTPVSTEQWIALVEQALNGADRFSPPPTRQGKTSVRKEMRLFLLYFCMLRGVPAPSDADGGYAVDHIIPEAEFEASTSATFSFRNRVTNLAIVPTSFNQRKSAHPMDSLPATHQTWLQGKISEYEQIDSGDLTKYTSAEDAPALHEYRASVVRETFTQHRSHFLEHLTPK